MNSLEAKKLSQPEDSEVSISFLDDEIIAIFGKNSTADQLITSLNQFVSKQLELNPDQLAAEYTSDFKILEKLGFERQNIGFDEQTSISTELARSDRLEDITDIEAERPYAVSFDLSQNSLRLIPLD